MNGSEEEQYLDSYGITACCINISTVVWNVLCLHIISNMYINSCVLCHNIISIYCVNSFVICHHHIISIYCLNCCVLCHHISYQNIKISTIVYYLRTLYHISHHIIYFSVLFFLINDYKQYRNLSFRCHGRPCNSE